MTVRGTITAVPEPTEVTFTKTTVRPGGQLTLIGVGCPEGETVTVQTDDPEIPGGHGSGAVWRPVLVERDQQPGRGRR